MLGEHDNAEPMSPDDLIPVADVMARWAYTEIVHSHFSSFYDGCASVDALRRKRSASIPFRELHLEERAVLFAPWQRVRRFFSPYIIMVQGYLLEQWTREQLLLVHVPPAVDPSRCQEYPLLGEYIFTEANDPRDPRNAHKEQYVFNPSTDPPPVRCGLNHVTEVAREFIFRR
jgi:hypothetical protein